MRSRERTAAVALLGNEPGTGLDFLAAFNRDLSTVFRGEVRGRLLLAKYDTGGLLLVGVLVAVAVLTVILVLYRLSRLFRRRARV